MRRNLLIFIAACFLLAAHSANARADFCLSTICAKAEVAGLGDIAREIEQWRQLLPTLRQDVRNDVEAIVDRVSARTIEAIDKAEQAGVRIAREAGAEVRAIIDAVRREIDALNTRFEQTYKRVLFDTECSSAAIIANARNSFDQFINGFVPSIPLFGGDRRTRISAQGFNLETLEERYNASSEVEKFDAAFRLLTRRLESATLGTPLRDIINVALERQRLAQSFHCATRSSMLEPSDQDSNHVFRLRLLAQRQYAALALLETCRRLTPRSASCGRP